MRDVIYKYSLGCSTKGQVLNSNNVAKSLLKWLWVTLGMPKWLNAKITYFIRNRVEMVVVRIRESSLSHNESQHRFRQFSSLHSLNKNTARSFPKWSGSVPAQLKTKDSALSACLNTTQWRGQTGSRHWAVRRFTWFKPDTISAAWVRTIHLPGMGQWVGCSPPPSAILRQYAVSSADPKSYHLPVLHPCYQPESNDLGSW